MNTSLIHLDHVHYVKTNVTNHMELQILSLTKVILMQLVNGIVITMFL